MNSACLTRRELLVRSAGSAVAAWALPRWLGAAPPAAAGGYQIGCYTRPWAAFDWRVAADAVAEAGYKHLGLMTTNSKAHLVLSVESTLDEAAEVGREAKQRGLQIPSVYGGGIPVNKSLEEGIAGLKHLVDCCAAAEAKSLLMGGIADEKLYDAYYKAIAECCDYAAERGVGITLKPHGGLTATPADCRKAVDRVNHKNFTIYYDAGNVMFYSNGELDPVAEAAAVDGKVSGWCVKDFSPTKPEPATPAKPGAKPPKYTGDVALTPGTGRVNFKGVLARLRQGGFTSGPLVVECLAPGDGQLPHLLAEAKKARQFMEELVGTC